MPLDVAILVATAVLAVVAVGAAVVAVRASRRIPQQQQVETASPRGAKATSSGARTGQIEPFEPDLAPLGEAGEEVATPGRIVEGRMVVVPTSEQVAVAALTRPSVRLATLGRGLSHALRPESRDRIAALMRREYRERRRARLRAGRQAARATHRAPVAEPTEHWLGELPAGSGGES